MTATAIAPDSSWLAAGFIDGTVLHWDWETGTRRELPTGRIGPICSLDISADDSTLAIVGAEGTVRIWHPRKVQVVATMRTDKPLTSGCWIPRERALVVSGDAGLYRFDVQDGYRESGRTRSQT